MKNKKGTFFILFGLLLIAVAFVIIGINVATDLSAGHKALKAMDQMKIDDTSGYEINPDMEMPAININGVYYIGILEIDDIGIKLPVIQEWSYNYLTMSPCRYSGSIYRDDMVIAAHNYNTHFGKLKDLTIGAPVKYTDVDGHEFNYEVTEISTLMPEAVDEMIHSDSDLTMFTCTLSGQSRVTVRCNRIEEGRH